jgi:hypothetical protein
MVAISCRQLRVRILVSSERCSVLTERTKPHNDVQMIYIIVRISVANSKFHYGIFSYLRNDSTSIRHEGSEEAFYHISPQDRVNFVTLVGNCLPLRREPLMHGRWLAKFVGAAESQPDLSSFRHHCDLHPSMGCFCGGNFDHGHLRMNW